MSELREARMAADAALRERELRAEVRELKRRIRRLVRVIDAGWLHLPYSIENELRAALAAPRKKTK